MRWELSNRGFGVVPSLVHEIRTAGGDAHSAYYPFSQVFDVPVPCRCYDTSPLQFTDIRDQLTVVPEVGTGYTVRIRHSQMVVCWFAVDSYLGRAGDWGLKDRDLELKDVVLGKAPADSRVTAAPASRSARVLS